VVAVQVLLVAYFLLLSSATKLPISLDFTIYYASVRYFWEGERIYAKVPVGSFGPMPEGLEFDRDTLHANLSPPAAMLLMAPLGRWELPTAYFIWSTFSIVCGIAAALLLGLAVGGKANRIGRTLALTFLLLAYVPTFTNVQIGQVGLVLLLLLSIVWVAARRGRDGVAGIALGLALTMKLFVGLLVLYFLVRRRWRLVAWSGAVLLLTSLASLIVFGPASFPDYARVLQTVTWYAINWNASLLGFFTRILGGSENIPLVVMPGLAYALSYGLSLLAVLALVWLSWPRDGEPLPAVLDVGFGLALALMLLVSPLGWMYYFPLLLIGVIGAWYASDRWLSGAYKWALVVAWILSTLPFPALQAVEVNDPLSWFTWASVYFYAALAFSLALGIILYRLRGKGARSVSPNSDGAA
jgi:alpha-1,2-mannosyltransferase